MKFLNTLKPTVAAHSLSGLSLNAPAAAKAAVAITRMSQGNFSNLKSLGGGVLEYGIDFGPGYRIYLGKDGERLMVLLGGGKKRQSTDIAAARLLAGL